MIWLILGWIEFAPITMLIISMDDDVLLGDLLLSVLTGPIGTIVWGFTLLSSSMDKIILRKKTKLLPYKDMCLDGNPFCKICKKDKL